MEKELILGYFPTLQDSLNEINRFKNAEASYSVGINGSKGAWESITSAAKNLSLPKSAKLVEIRTTGGQGKLYMNNKLKLACSLSLENMSIEDNDGKLLNIDLGGFKLSCTDLAVSETRIGNITGNGIQKGSALELVYTGAPGKLKVNGKLDKVGSVTVTNGEIEVVGEKNVGEEKKK